MKQLKFILLSAIAVVTINSCSTDRDEEVRPEPVAKLILKPQKIEKNNNQGTARTGDTLISPRTTSTHPGTSPDPIDPNNPNGPGEVVDPTKPDKPW